MQIILAFSAALLVGMMLFRDATAQISIQPVRWNLPVTIPSPRESISWFPNLAVDSKGNVHFVWCETSALPDGDQESIYYSTWNGSQWSQYVDIASPAPDIRRNSIVIDEQDVLHMTYVDSREGNPYRIVYTAVEVDKAFSAANWAPMQYINERGVSYFNEISAFKNTLHVVYEDTGNTGGACSGCADMFYRRSVDGGDTWESAIRLLETEGGSSRPHISLDRNGILYVSWDEGWDRLTGFGSPEFGLYTMSKDQGETWAEPMVIRYPDNTNSQLVVEGDGGGGIMLVWRTTSPSYPGVYYIWSSDYGVSWTQPATLASFVSRDMINYFDSYDMATDSAGHIHLLVTGYQVASDGRRGATPGLFHYEWDGQRWYPPTVVYTGGLIPEYARLVIERGNQLHATWFVRHDAYSSVMPHEVMYASGISAAPAIEPAVPVATYEFTNTVEVVESAQSTSTPVLQITPTLEPVDIESSASLYTEYDEYAVLLISLIPVSLILGAIMIIVRRRQRY
jgi:hypothetical protein